MRRILGRIQSKDVTSTNYSSKSCNADFHRFNRRSRPERLENPWKTFGFARRQTAVAPVLQFWASNPFFECRHTIQTTVRRDDPVPTRFVGKHGTSLIPLPFPPGVKLSCTRVDLAPADHSPKHFDTNCMVGMWRVSKSRPRPPSKRLAPRPGFRSSRKRSGLDCPIIIHEASSP